MNRFRTLVSFSVLLGICSGCASLFTAHDQHAWLMTPDSVRVFDHWGRPLKIDTTRLGEKIVHLTSPDDDSVFVRYRTRVYQVRPARTLRAAACLDALTGYGLFIDDVTNNAYDYIDVSFDGIDTSSVLSRSDTPLDTLMLPAKPNDLLYAFLQAGISGFYNFDQVPLLPFFRDEIGLGIGYNKRIELFANYEYMDLMHLTNENTNRDFTGLAITESIRARLYPYKGLYASVGYGLLRAYSPDIYASASNSTDSLIEKAASSKFHVAIFAVGYSASFAFVEYQRAYALHSPVIFGSQPLTYSFGILKFGVNVRVP